MLEHIYVVVGSGISDIGKGWLTGSIASLLPNALPVKIDPMLNRQFPSDIGIPLEEGIVSGDLLTYRELGLPVYPDCNIVGGALLHEFLQQPETKYSHGRIKKLTFAYVSEFLADKLLSLVTRLESCRNLVIEVGGIVTDLEHIYIPAAIRFLGFKTGITPEMVILSYFEYSESDEGVYSLKSHNIRNAIQETRRSFSLPIKACFVRRRHVPEKVTEEQIKEELVITSFLAHMPPAKMICLPNVTDIDEFKKMVEKTGIFKDETEKCLVSACLLGIPCRYDGTTDALDQRVVSLLKEREVITVCPELLAGLPIPRRSVEIIGGDGYDVLDGDAKVMSVDGNDYTQQFIDGARKALEITKRTKIAKAILYYRSPSCGCLQIYDGSFRNRLKPGYGVFGALLERNGIRCIPNTKMKG